MVVVTEIGIAIGNSWAVESKKFLVNDDALGLKLNRLKIVTLLEMNVCKFGNARSDIGAHWTCDLH